MRFPGRFLAPGSRRSANRVRIVTLERSRGGRGSLVKIPRARAISDRATQRSVVYSSLCRIDSRRALEFSRRFGRQRAGNLPSSLSLQNTFSTRRDYFLWCISIEKYCVCVNVYSMLRKKRLLRLDPIRFREIRHDFLDSRFVRCLSRMVLTRDGTSARGVRISVTCARLYHSPPPPPPSRAITI